MRRLFGASFDAASLVLLWIVARLPRQPARRLVWGPIAVINNKYWSAAMREAGWDSVTLVEHVATINRREDWDLLFDDVVPRWIPSRLRARVGPVAAAAYVLRHATVLHCPFSGGPLGQTRLWRFEARLLARAGVRTVVIPFGGDVAMPSRIADPLVRTAYMASYPDLARFESRTVARVEYWSRHADVIVVGFTLDGLPRWDVPVGNMIAIDVEAWQLLPTPPTGGTIRILHTPNHRAVKGTDFLVAAVEQLRREGLDVELVLLEGVPNEGVRAELAAVHIVADQFILPGYGLAAIEAMASGRPVLCNLEHRDATRLFDSLSFLGECPVVSTTPDSLLDDLRVLVTRDDLRGELGAAGRAYVEKYHSYAAAQHLFGSLYRFLLDGEAVDLLSLFDSRSSDYATATPRVEHPLSDHRLPHGAAPHARGGRTAGDPLP